MIVRRNSRQAVAHALTPTIARPARTTPPGVSAITGSPPRNRVTWVPSKIRTPRSSSTRRRPRASRAGCTSRGVDDVDPATGHRRVEPRADLARIELAVDLVEAEPAHLFEHLLDPVILGGARRNSQVAHRRVPGVDAVSFAPRADLVDRTRCHLDGATALVAEPGREQPGLVVERVEEPAVATARAAAAHVLLEQHDVEVGLALFEEERAPHPRVAAADHDDVGCHVAIERGTGLARELRPGERLLEPPAPVGRTRQVLPSSRPQVIAEPARESRDEHRERVDAPARVLEVVLAPDRGVRDQHARASGRARGGSVSARASRPRGA